MEFDRHKKQKVREIHPFIAGGFLLANVISIIVSIFLEHAYVFAMTSIPFLAYLVWYGIFVYDDF